MKTCYVCLLHKHCIQAPGGVNAVQVPDLFMRELQVKMRV